MDHYTGLHFGPGHVLSLEQKTSLAQAGPAEEIAIEIAEFFPTGRFLY
jgi:hypothetical protein